MPPKTSGKAAKKSGVMNCSNNQVFSAQHRLCRKFDGTFPYSVSYPVNVTELQISDLDYGYIGYIRVEEITAMMEKVNLAGS